MIMIILTFVFGLIYISIYYKHKKNAAEFIKQKGINGIIHEINIVEENSKKSEEK